MNSSSLQQEKKKEEEEEEEEKFSCKKMVRYKECLKNHAAAIGGNAIDGCGEFMPSGEDGTIEALKCSACNCHRNFHRKEMECDSSSHFQCRLFFNRHHHQIQNPPDHHQHQVVSGRSGSVRSESDEKDDGGGAAAVVKAGEKSVRKRFRTKFTQEQKEKMMKFAEKAGWRIQKLEESVVQQFCQEIGIKRRVLKVWMHNNKHNLAKKNNFN
ncbi:Zinc-finger homeodomain protein [Melia azedarach]|uniref:Zinc-finger homeodomain protein n=1 Tax=Melia azedarach TaxID=155640 RepID=A0ACC1XXT3_MELAZ|nr:Zinc-finger homeodomain protein [Melia azedarach]